MATGSGTTISAGNGKTKCAKIEAEWKYDTLQ